jgi:hypothetical protein
MTGFFSTETAAFINHQHFLSLIDTFGLLKVMFKAYIIKREFIIKLTHAVNFNALIVPSFNLLE